MAAGMKDLYIPPVQPTDKQDRLVSTLNSLVRWYNGLAYNGQITRTGQDTWVLGGGGGPPLDVPSGGTGQSSLTVNSVLLGEGTDPIGFAGPGAQGLALISQGLTDDPAFDVLSVQGGGTGNTTLANHSILLGNGVFSVAQLLPVAAGAVLVSFGTGSNPIYSPDPVLGLAGVTQGSLAISGSAGGAVFIKVQTTTGTFNFNLPAAAGSSGQSLLSGGGGASAMTWGSPSLLVGTTTITSGTSGRILYDNAGVLGEMTTTGSGTVAVLATSPTITTSLLLGTAFTLSDSGGGNGRIVSQSGGLFSVDTDRFLLRNQAASQTFLDVNASANTITIGRNTSTVFTSTGRLIVGSSITIQDTGSNNGRWAQAAGGLFSFDSDRTLLRNAATTNVYLDVVDSTNTILLGRNTSTVTTVNGFIAPAATQTTVAGSIAGTAVFSQTFTGTTFKRVLIYLNALNGTASYTYPTPFTNKPSFSPTNDIAAGIVTSLSNTAVTVTGVVTTGFVELVGY